LIKAADKAGLLCQNIDATNGSGEDSGPLSV